MSMSLRVRLILASLLWVSVGVALAGFILSATFRDHVTRQLESDLSADMDELRAVTSKAPSGGVSTSRPLSDPRFEAPSSGHYWIIRNGGRVAAKSVSLGNNELPLPQGGPIADGQLHYHTIMGPTGLIRVAERTYGLVSDPGKLHLMVGTDWSILKTTVRRFNNTLAWSMGGFAISMIVLAILMLLYATRPLAQVQRALADVRAGRAKQIRGKYPSEVRPLVDDLNAMMDAMGKTTQKARAQAGNLAHSLKTPLAVLTDEAYSVEKSGLTNSASVMFEQCRRMQRHIDYQLARTRSAATRSVPGTSARVADVVGSVSSALARLYVGGGVRIEPRVSEDLFVACDFQDLNEIVANLIDNALKHARTTVVVSARRGIASPAPAVEIVVEDDGPGLPPEAWNVVFDIGERWDSRAKGTGLGLPIVRDLVQLYGGRVQLGKSALGGLEVSIALPAVPDC